MKRLISLFLLVAFLAMAMGGCGPKPKPPETPTAQPTEVPTAAPTATPTAQPTEVSTAAHTATPTQQPTPEGTPASASQDDTQTRPTAVFEMESDETLALVNGTLIDGTSADPLPDTVVVIQKGRIIAVGSHVEVDVPVDAKIIDVRGATILPGFINAHVHMGYNEQNLEAWAQAGVTTVRDLGGPSLFSFRDLVLKDSQYARLVAAGPIVTVPDGYPIVPFGSTNVLTVTSPEDTRQKVSRLLDDDADFIKIALEGGRIFGRNIPMLSPEESAVIVEVAHERETLVSAHVTVSRDLARALDAGVDDIAHMVTDNLPDELAERMVQDDVYWVPTIELWKGVGHGFGEKAVENLRRFVNAGGKVALGTDYAGYYTEFDLGMPIREIEWMQKADMTPMQIIVAGTKNAAHVCNLDHELGTLEVGKIADVLVVDGDPLDDIHALTNVRMVLHNGAVIRGGNER
jgi:imidazolonepropionase-like amidohydrolase